MTRVLYTFAGGSYGLGIARSLRAASRGYYLIAADADPYSLQRAEADEMHLIPPASDISFLPRLQQLIWTTGADFVWPGHDSEIQRLARAREEIDAQVFLPPASEVDLCNDKFESYKRWKQAGLSVPETILVRDRDDLESAFDTFGRQVWLRSVSGAGGRGAVGLSSLEKAVAWLDFLEGWGSFTAARWIKDGQRFSWESVWASGQLIAVQGRTQLAQGFSNLTMSGITGVPGVNRWGTPPQADEVGVAAVRAISASPHGNYGVDVVSDSEGTLYVTEINIGRYNNDGLIHWPDEKLNAADLAVRLGMDQPLPFTPPIVHPKKGGNLIIYGLPKMPVEMSEDELTPWS